MYTIHYTKPIVPQDKHKQRSKGHLIRTIIHYTIMALIESSSTISTILVVKSAIHIIYRQDNKNQCSKCHLLSNEKMRNYHDSGICGSEDNHKSP